MEIRKTKSGWVFEITNRSYGMLEQGGICGREVLYKRETLEKLGIDYNDDPDGNWNEFVSNAEYLYHTTEPDKVIKKGHRIQ